MPESNAKEETKKSNFKPVGRSGTLVTSDIIQQDYLSSMNGVEGQELFAKMLLSDSQIRKTYHAVSNPIKSANWDIEPASDDTKDLEAAALMKQIIFNDIPDGFRGKLDEILTFPWHGHAVFEVVHANKISKQFGAYTGLANLAFRDQRTLTKWIFTPEGVLDRIKQEQSGDIEIDAEMSADTLLIFYNEKKGNDNGFPFCRMLYGNYKRKLLYKQLQAIGIERAAIPVPHLQLPVGVDFDSQEYADAVSQLAAFTQAEQAFFVTPAEYVLNYHQTGTFDPSKVQSAIKAENEEIVGSLVAMWLEMGIGGNSGNQAGTAVSSENFRDGIEYLADKIADKINNELIPNLMALNYGGTFETLPKLVHSGIADEVGEELMRIVTGYVDKGIIIPDEALEDFVRASHSLPKKVAGAMIDNGVAENGTPPEDPKEVLKKEEMLVDDVELSAKEKATPKTLMEQQAEKISKVISETVSQASAKYVNDVMTKYKQLPQGKKQNATNKTNMGFTVALKKDLKRIFTETASLSIAMAKKEIPSKADVELSSKENDWLRMTDRFGDYSEIKLNDFSKLPAHIQVLIAKQADLISAASLNELKERIDFSFSSIETRSQDENIIKQSMEDEAAKFAASSQMDVKGVNSASLIVNEGRDAFFSDEDVLEDIHSFTFVNIAPKSAICRELAGTTFNTNDATSLMYSPPLHHNCKSYLRANLKSSKGIENLEVSTLSPSAEAKKSITL